MGKRKATVFSAKKVRTVDLGRPDVNAVAALDGIKRLTEAVNADIPAQVLLGIETKRDTQAKAPTPTDPTHDFESVRFTINEPLDGDRLHGFLETSPDALLRAKGQVNLAEAPSLRTICQRVGKRWNYATAEPWGRATLEVGLDAGPAK